MLQHTPIPSETSVAGAGSPQKNPNRTSTMKSQSRIDRIDTKEQFLQTKISFLKGKAKAFFYNGKYVEAAKLLEDIQSLQNYEDIDALLLMTECYFYLQSSVERASDCACRLHAVIMASNSFPIDGISSWGHALIESGRFHAATLIYQTAMAKTRVKATSPDKAIEFFSLLASHIVYLVPALRDPRKRSHTNVFNYVYKFLNEILESVRDVPGTTSDNKAVVEAKCMHSLVCLCNYASEYSTVTVLANKAIEILETQFSANPSNYYIYSFLLYNLGNAHFNLGKHDEAQTSLLKCRAAAENATDFSNESERQGFIQTTDLCLTKVLEKLQITCQHLEIPEAAQNGQSKSPKHDGLQS